MKRAWIGGALLFTLGLAAGLTAQRIFRHGRGPEDSGGGAPAGVPAPISASLLNRREAGLQKSIDDLDPMNGSSVYNIKVHRYYTRFIEEYLGRDAPARMLEIGPGINLGTGLLFAMSGAEKYYGLDIYKDPNLYAAPQYESIVTLLSKVGPGQIRRPPEEIMTAVDGQVTFKQDRAEYLYPHQSYDIPLADGSLDFVFSHAAFEHIADPAKTVEAVWRVLRPGGVTAHHIDLRDHRDFSRPVEFLKLDAETWKAKYEGPDKAYLYMNRWRASDFKAALEKTGFQILRFEPTDTYPVTEAMRRTFHPDFQRYSLQDLSVTGVTIVARKPAAP